MSFALLPVETLSCILTDPSFSDQTISFGEESIEVNKTILAASSTYFLSLWFLEFGDKQDNPIDFSHLPGSSATFFSFIRSFYGKPFTLTDSNVYHFFYLIHYFQVNKLADQFENHLNVHLVTWAWLKPFIKEADERNDWRALEFVGPLFSKIDDILIDDVMTISTEGYKPLVEYCTSTQSLSWFIKSLVSSILNQNFDSNEVSNILNSCSVEALSLQQWKEYLFVPLKHENSDLKEEISELNSLTTDLKTENQDLKTENTGLSREVHDSKTEISHLKTTNSALTTDIQNLTATNSNSLNEITKLQQEIDQLKKTATETQLVFQSIHQSKVIRFSQTRKHSQLQVSGDRKRVVVGSGNGVCRNILGEDPLLPGNVYTWKLRYQGRNCGLYVGVIDESKFRVDCDCTYMAHCYACGDTFQGCLFGTSNKWNPGELLEINANLTNYTLTIKSVSNFSINLTGTLPKLSSGNYYPFASLFWSDHELEIVE
ncbi:hypothetical protein GEMRC1_000322 [Eukaryota sp. GEM-RC1]